MLKPMGDIIFTSLFYVYPLQHPCLKPDPLAPYLLRVNCLGVLVRELPFYCMAGGCIHDIQLCS